MKEDIEINDFDTLGYNANIYTCRQSIVDKKIFLLIYQWFVGYSLIPKKYTHLDWNGRTTIETNWTC